MYSYRTKTCNMISWLNNKNKESYGGFIISESRWIEWLHILPLSPNLLPK